MDVPPVARREPTALLSRSFRAIGFDLDGTLVDRDAGVRDYIWNQAQQLGLSPDDWRRYETRFLKLDQQGHAPKNHVFASLKNEFGLEPSVEELVDHFREEAGRKCPLFPEVRRTLTALRGQGVKLAILTNGTSRMQRAKLVSCGLSELVDAVLISEEMGARKPEPAAFRLMCDLLAVSPKECAYVGDHPMKDIAGAQSAGIFGILVERRPVELEDAKPDMIVQDLSRIHMRHLSSD